MWSKTLLVVATVVVVLPLLVHTSDFELCHVCTCAGPFLFCLRSDIVLGIGATKNFTQVALADNAGQQSCDAFRHQTLETIDLRGWWTDAAA